MANDSLYDSLVLVSNMQRRIDDYELLSDDLYLNLISEHTREIIKSKFGPLIGFEQACKFIEFIRTSHPEILEEWRQSKE